MRRKMPCLKPEEEERHHVFILGISLGITALTLRSPAVIAGVGLLIVTAFAIATALLGTLHIVPLVLALVGYNAGILAGFVAMMTLQKFRPFLGMWRISA